MVSFIARALRMVEMRSRDRQGPESCTPSMYAWQPLGENRQRLVSRGRARSRGPLDDLKVRGEVMDTPLNIVRCLHCGGEPRLADTEMILGWWECSCGITITTGRNGQIISIKSPSRDKWRAWLVCRRGWLLCGRKEQM